MKKKKQYTRKHLSERSEFFYFNYFDVVAMGKGQNKKIKRNFELIEDYCHTHLIVLFIDNIFFLFF